MDGDKVETWYDASGRGRDPTQLNAGARPTFLGGDAPALLFSGEGTHLALTGLGRSFPQATVVLVAAPFDDSGDFRAFWR